jgi:hypothetical protein
VNTVAKARLVERIRAACCPYHGLGGHGLDDPRPLDEHAAAIVADVVRSQCHSKRSPTKETL